MSRAPKIVSFSAPLCHFYHLGTSLSPVWESQIVVNFTGRSSDLYFLATHVFTLPISQSGCKLASLITLPALLCVYKAVVVAATPIA